MTAVLITGRALDPEAQKEKPRERWSCTTRSRQSGGDTPQRLSRGRGSASTSISDVLLPSVRQCFPTVSATQSEVVAAPGNPHWSAMPLTSKGGSFKRHSLWVPWAPRFPGFFVCLLGNEPKSPFLHCPSELCHSFSLLPRKESFPHPRPSSALGPHVLHCFLSSH